MSEKSKKKNKLNRKKLGQVVSLLIIAIIAVCIFYSIINLLIEPSDVFVIENGKIYQEETNIGYVIRDEKLVFSDEHQNGIVTIKPEGSKVAKGDSIFRYCSQNEQKLEEKISELDKEIQKAIEGQNTSIYSTDIQLLEKQIEEKISLLQTTNKIDEIAEYKSEISSYMIRKAKIAGELSPSGSYINKLITQRSEYEQELNSGQQYISAPESGTVSYKIDGYEESLTVNNIETITKEILDSVKIKTGQLISSSSEQGKVVNNFYCYIATVLSSDNAMSAKEGDIIKLRLSNHDEISAEIVRISDFNDGEAVVVFKITQDVEYLIGYRKISIDVIWWNASGLKVPNSSIITEDDKNYVIRNRVGYTDKILVKIEKQNENYAIIKSYTTEELMDLGYTTNEIPSMKSISLYDEIVLKP
ncbi:MAG: hypothetical protein HFJ19_02640 [Clostridia bacterium]|nr:hypothetical protein [Clostridia bacterium]